MRTLKYLNIFENVWPTLQEARYGITKCTYRISNIREAVQIRREQLIGIEFKHQIAETLFNALKPIYFDLLRYIPEKSNLVNIVKNNYGATLKYKILDGYVKPVTFSDHTTPLYLIFFGEAIDFGPENFVFKINWKNMYLSNSSTSGINRPWYLWRRRL